MRFRGLWLKPPFIRNRQEAEEDEVAKGQQFLWKKGIAHKGPVTDDLGNKYRWDGVHFNKLGLKTHAERWFNVLSAEFEWKAASSNKRINHYTQ